MSFVQVTAIIVITEERPCHHLRGFLATLKVTTSLNYNTTLKYRWTIYAPTILGMVS